MLSFFWIMTKGWYLWAPKRVRNPTTEHVISGSLPSPPENSFKTSVIVVIFVVDIPSPTQFANYWPTQQGHVTCIDHVALKWYICWSPDQCHATSTLISALVGSGCPLIKHPGSAPGATSRDGDYPAGTMCHPPPRFSLDRNLSSHQMLHTLNCRGLYFFCSSCQYSFTVRMFPAIPNSKFCAEKVINKKSGKIELNTPENSEWNTAAPKMYCWKSFGLICVTKNHFVCGHCTRLGGGNTITLSTILQNCVNDKKLVIFKVSVSQLVHNSSHNGYDLVLSVSV